MPLQPSRVHGDSIHGFLSKRLKSSIASLQGTRMEPRRRMGNHGEPDATLMSHGFGGWAGRSVRHHLSARRPSRYSGRIASMVVAVFQSSPGIASVPPTAIVQTHPRRAPTEINTAAATRRGIAGIVESPYVEDAYCVEARAHSTHRSGVVNSDGAAITAAVPR